MILLSSTNRLISHSQHSFLSSFHFSFSHCPFLPPISPFSSISSHSRAGFSSTESRYFVSSLPSSWKKYALNYSSLIKSLSHYNDHCNVSTEQVLSYFDPFYFYLPSSILYKQLYFKSIAQSKSQSIQSNSSTDNFQQNPSLPLITVPSPLLFPDHNSNLNFVSWGTSNYQFSTQPYQHNSSLPIEFRSLVPLPPSLLPHISSSPIVRPVHVEIGSGMGEWIRRQCFLHPENDYYAIELNHKRAMYSLGGYIASFIDQFSRNSSLRYNLRVIEGNAKYLFDHHIADNSIDQIYLNFSDPFQKIKQTGRRVLTDSFIAIMSKKMKTNAKLSIVTDHPQLRDYMINNLLTSSSQQAQFHCHYPQPFYLEQVPEEYGLSAFGKVFASRGLPLFFSEFTKV